MTNGRVATVSLLKLIGDDPEAAARIVAVENLIFSSFIDPDPYCGRRVEELLTEQFGPGYRVGLVVQGSNVTPVVQVEPGGTYFPLTTFVFGPGP